MMLSNNLCYFQVNSYGKKKKTGHIIVVLLTSTAHSYRLAQLGLHALQILQHYSII